MMWAILWTILAILCIIYSAMVFAIGSGTGFFFVWFGMGVCFLLCAIAARVHLWQKIPFPVKMFFLCVLAVCAAFFIFVEARIISAFENAPEKKLDYIIVLGAQVKEDGPSIVLRYRLDTAADYLKENPDTLCIVSGGQGYNEPFPEAVGMKNYLVSAGIPKGRILLETGSKNTNENMEFSRKLFDPVNDHVGIVTSNFHIYRACSIARKKGIANFSAIPAVSTPLYLPNNLLREFFGLTKDFIEGNI